MKNGAKIGSKWITSKENPLTARTIVNRIWYKIFGRGIVNSIEDMGTNQRITPCPFRLVGL